MMREASTLSAARTAEDAIASCRDRNGRPCGNRPERSLGRRCHPEGRTEVAHGTPLPLRDSLGTAGLGGRVERCAGRGSKQEATCAVWRNAATWRQLPP